MDSQHATQVNTEIKIKTRLGLLDTELQYFPFSSIFHPLSQLKSKWFPGSFPGPDQRLREMPAVAQGPSGHRLPEIGAAAQWGDPQRAAELHGSLEHGPAVLHLEVSLVTSRERMRSIGIVHFFTLYITYTQYYIYVINYI